MPKRTFKLGEDIFDVEDANVSAFLKSAPDAIEMKSFVLGSDTFDVELPKVDMFLKQVPNAKPLFGEAKTAQPKWQQVGVEEMKAKSKSYPEFVPGINFDNYTEKTKSALKSKKSEIDTYQSELSKINQELKPFEEIAAKNNNALPQEYMDAYKQTYSKAKDLENKYIQAQKAYNLVYDDFIKQANKEDKLQKENRVKKGQEYMKENQLPSKAPLQRIKSYQSAIQNIQARIPQLVEAYGKAESMGNQEAMAEYKSRIDSDSEAIKKLEAGIEMQKNIAKEVAPTSVSDALVNGAKMLVGSALKAPELFSTVYEAMWNELGLPTMSDKMKEELKEFEKKTPIKDPQKVAYEAGKKILDETKETSELRNLNLKYSGSAWDALMKGDFSSALKNSTIMFAESLPTSAAISVGGYAAPFIAAGMAQENIDDVKKGETANMNEVFAGISMAGLEYATENLLGTGKSLKNLISKVGKEEASDIAAKLVTESAKKSLAKKIGRNYVEEIAGEELTTIGQNAAKKYVLGEDVGLFDGTGDTFMVSLFGASTQGVLTETASHYVDKSKAKKIQEKSELSQSLIERAQQTPNVTVANALEAEADKLNDEIESEQEQVDLIAANATPETLESLSLVFDELNELEEQIVNIESTPDVEKTPQIDIELKILKDTYAQKEKEYESLKEKAKKEANQKIEQDATIPVLESLKIEEDIIEPEKSEDSVVPVLESLKASKEELKDATKNKQEVKYLIGSRVEFEGEVGYINQDEGGKITFENDNKTIELEGNEIATEFIPESVSLEGDKLSVGENNYTLISVNENSQGEAVSVTVLNDAGKKITLRDSDLANAVLKTKTIQEYESLTDLEDVSVEDEISIVGVELQKEFGGMAMAVIESMPDEVADTFVAMESGIVSLEADALEDMVLRSFEWAETAISNIEKGSAPKKEKKEAIRILEKFKKDLNKYYNEIKKQQSKSSVPNAKREGESESGKGNVNEKTKSKSKEKVDEPTIIESDTPKGDTRVEVTEPTIQEGEGQVEVEKEAEVTPQVDKGNSVRGKSKIAKRIRDNIKDLPEKDLGDAEANKNWNDIRESRKTIKSMSDEELLKEVQKGMDGKKINQAIYESYFGMDITAKDIEAELQSLKEKTTTPPAKEQTKEAPKPLEIKEEAPIKEQGVEIKEQTNPALKDVEATVKALEEVDDNGELNKISTEKEINIDDIVEENADGQTLSDAIINVKDGLKSQTEGNILVYESGGKYYIADGFHRVAEAKLKGTKSIQADVVYAKPKDISEAYHKAKADGSNPELVQAVEELLGTESTRTEDVSKKEPKIDTKTETAAEELLSPKTENKVEPTSEKTLEDVRKNPDEFRIIKSFDAKFARSFGVQDGKPFINKVNLASGVREYSDYPISNESNRPIRYVMMLADKSNYENYFIMSYDGYIRLTKPEWWEKIKQYKAKDYRQQILIFELLPKEEQDSFIDSLLKNPDNYSLNGSFDIKKAFTDTPFDMLSNLTSEAYEKFTKREFGEKRIPLNSRVSFEANKISEKFTLNEKLPFGVKGYSTDYKYKSDAWYKEFYRLLPTENKVEPTAEKTLDAKNEPNKVVEKTLEGELTPADDKAFDELDLISPELKEAFNEIRNKKPLKSKAKPKDTKFTEALDLLKKENNVAYQIAKTIYYKVKIDPFFNEIGNEILKSDKSTESVAEILQKYIKKAEAQEDKVIKSLEKLKADTKGKMNAFGIIPAVWNTAIDTIILAYKGGKLLNEAIQDGIEYLESQKVKADLEEVRKYFNEKLGVKEEKPTEETPTQAPEPPKQGPKLKQSGFQVRSLMGGPDEVSAQIAKDNPIVYEAMNLKDEYEEAKGVIKSYQDVLDNDDLINENAPKGKKTQALRLMAMQQVSLKISELVQAGKDASKATNLYVRIMQATAKDATESGQENAILALWKFSTPEGIISSFMSKIEEVNKNSLELLTDAEKQMANEMIEGLKEKVAELEKQLAEQIVKTAKRASTNKATEANKPSIVKDIEGGKITDSNRKAVSDFFDKFLIKTDGGQTFAVPLPPQIWNGFVLGVKNLVLGGMKLNDALRKASAELIRNKQATPKETVAASKELYKLFTEQEMRESSIRKTLRSLVNDEKLSVDEAINMLSDKKSKEMLEATLSKDALKKARTLLKNGEISIDEAMDMVLNQESKDALQELNAEEILKEVRLLVKQGKITMKEAMDMLLDQKSKEALQESMGELFTKVYGTSKIPLTQPKSRKTDLDKIVEGAVQGALNDNFYKALFLEKFGLMANLNSEQINKLNELATAVFKLQPATRTYNLAVFNMIRYMKELYPTNKFRQLLDTWFALNYGNMLSGPTTTAINLYSTGSNVFLQSFKTLGNYALWARAINKGIKDKDLQTFKSYSPLVDLAVRWRASYNSLGRGLDQFISTLRGQGFNTKYVEDISRFTGEPQISELERAKYGDNRFIGGKINPANWLKYVIRFLVAQDAFAYNTVYEASMSNLLLDEYRNKGLKGKELLRAVQESVLKQKVNFPAIQEQVLKEVKILRKAGVKVTRKEIRTRISEVAVDLILKDLNVKAEQVQEVKDLASSSTFTDNRYGLISRMGEGLGQAANRTILGKLLLKPWIYFVKIPTNVIETMLDSNPYYGVLRTSGYSVTGLTNKVTKKLKLGEFQTAQMGEIGSKKYYEQMGRAFLGINAFVLMAMISGDDDDDLVQLTGGLAKERKEGAYDATKVKNPYVLKIGKFELPYLNIPPLAIPLGLIGNYNDYMRLHKNDSEGAANRMFLAMWYANAETLFMVKDLSFLQGIQTITEAINKIFTQGESKLDVIFKTLYAQYGGFLTRPLPQNNNLILQIEQFFDDKSYSKKTVEDITYYILGLQHMLGKPSVDILGEDVKRLPGEQFILYDKWFRDEVVRPELSFLFKYNAMQPRLKNSETKIFNPETGEFESRIMTRDEFYDYNKLAGKKFAQKIGEYMLKTTKDGMSYAEKRASEIEKIQDKDKKHTELTGLQKDMNDLHSEAQQEAKRELFIDNLMTPEELATLKKFEEVEKEAKLINKEAEEEVQEEIKKAINPTKEEQQFGNSLKNAPNATARVALFLNRTKGLNEKDFDNLLGKMLDLGYITNSEFGDIITAKKF